MGNGVRDVAASGIGARSVWIYSFFTVCIMMFLIVRDGYSAEGWRRLGFKFRGGKEYILALVIPLGSLGAGYAVYWMGWNSSLISPDSWIKTAIYLLVYIVLGSLSALGEEIGWRVGCSRVFNGWEE